MVELWIPITVFAAFMQNVRSALQKHLKGALSTSGATFVRFGYGIPFVLVYFAVLAGPLGLPLPQPNGWFVLYTVVGGLTQIVATALLIYLFGFRNFAVGTAYSKTETVQTAIFGIVILGDAPTLGAALGILVSLAGVMAISIARTSVDARGLLRSLTEKTALIGIASGAFFGMAAVSYRAASLSLGSGDFLMRATFTLTAVVLLQSAVMAVYILWREPGQMRRILASWKVSSWVGLSGVAGSAGWFTAMTIQNAAYVRALGQIELVFTFIASYLFFHERSNRTEIIGILLIVGGIVVLLLGH